MNMTKEAKANGNRAGISRRLQGPVLAIFCSLSVLLPFSAGAGGAGGADWPQWGRDPSKNMAAPDAQAIPADFSAGRPIGRTGRIDPTTTRHIKWVARLGSQTYGNPTVADGKVYVGTNNASQSDPKYPGDRSVVLCLDEQSGKLIWQFNLHKLGAGKVSDWEYLGICSSPAVDGDRVYVVTNLCEVVCLDSKGLADGNDGFEGEPQYLAGPGKPPIALGPADADVIWRFDMRDELLVSPHNITSTSPLLINGRVWVATSNGVDWSHLNIPNPRAPALICLDVQTGELVGEEASGICSRVLHCNWSSAAFGSVNGQGMIFLGSGDGYAYAFDPVPAPDEDGFGILNEIWRFDCNPPTYRVTADGEPIRYPTHDGPSEAIATAVFHDNRVYLAIGQDPEHGLGLGALSCIDATKQGDISQSGLIWRYTDIDRSISTVSVADGLVYAADYAGVVHCLDAATGKVLWKHDTLGHIWGSTLLADGKVFVGNEDGILTILKHGRRKQVIAAIEFPAPIYASPIVANGVLYVAAQTHLYAIADQDK